MVHNETYTVDKTPWRSDRLITEPSYLHYRETNIHASSVFFFVLALYFCPYFFVLIVLAFAFCPYSTSHTTQTSVPPAGSKPAIPASDRPQTFALAFSATGIRTRNPSKRSAADPHLSATGDGFSSAYWHVFQLYTLPPVVCWVCGVCSN
jgi:hypothetical protein